MRRRARGRRCAGAGGGGRKAPGVAQLGASGWRVRARARAGALGRQRTVRLERVSRPGSSINESDGAAAPPLTDEVSESSSQERLGACVGCAGGGAAALMVLLDGTT